MELGRCYRGYEGFVFPGGNVARQWTCSGDAPRWECEASGLRGKVHGLDAGDGPFVALNGGIKSVWMGIYSPLNVEQGIKR